MIILYTHYYDNIIAQVPPSQLEVTPLIICPYKWEPMKELYTYYGDRLSSRYRGIGYLYQYHYIISLIYYIKDLHQIC